MKTYVYGHGHRHGILVLVWMLLAAPALTALGESGDEASTKALVATRLHEKCTWTSTSGGVVFATFVYRSASEVVLENDAGVRRKIPMSSLSRADRQFLRENAPHPRDRKEEDAQDVLITMAWRRRLTPLRTIQQRKVAAGSLGMRDTLTLTPEVTERCKKHTYRVTISSPELQSTLPLTIRYAILPQVCSIGGHNRCGKGGERHSP